MDSFTTFSPSASAPVKIPKDTENPNGQGGGTHCVAFAKEIPTDSENPNGQGGGTHCIIA